MHFPFCEAKCHYCDFFSFAENKFALPARTKIYDAILKEWDVLNANFPNAHLNKPLETVFFGGGTPSLVPLEFIESLLQKLPRHADCEVTMEANPSSIDPAKASAWAKAGITRISMGVQALNDDRLKWLGRVHSKKQIFDALESLRAAREVNPNFRVNIDYIVGVPNQTISDIDGEIRELMNSHGDLIGHISSYLLTLRPSSPWIKDLPSEEIQLDHLKATDALLAELGFEHYEISNFARPGFRCGHNENYWLGKGYIGLGPSAHGFWRSTNDSFRTKVWSNLEKYVDSVQKGLLPWEWVETLDPEQRRLEFLLLRLRRVSGFCIEEYNEEFDRDFLKENQRTLPPLLKDGYIHLNHSEAGKTQLSLTSLGFFMSDEILKYLQ